MRFADLAAGFATRAVDHDDRGTVTSMIYSASSSVGRSTLFSWEEPWLSAALPPPPARVLLGGAGRGREARWLIDHGYTVHAFDPAPASVSHHNAVCPEARCIVLDYESLARGSQTLGSGDVGPLADNVELVTHHAPYDAALLGWGSLTHVLEERAQDALFEALASLVPRGPILASFFMGSLQSLGRANTLGAWIGRALGSAEYARAGDSVRVRCFAHIGFVYSFDRERLLQLAERASRTLELHADGAYPHATFRKLST